MHHLGFRITNYVLSVTPVFGRDFFVVIPVLPLLLVYVGVRLFFRTRMNGVFNAIIGEILQPPKRYITNN